MNRVFSEFVDPDSDDRWLAIDIPIREEPDDDDGEGNSDGYSE